MAGEITANIDAYWSVYFYKDIFDPLLYWGPLWDEDLAYNNTTRLGDVTEELMADVGHGRRFAGKWIDQLKVGTTWFWPDVLHYYREHYNNGLTDFMTHTIDSLAEQLRPSAAMNFKVWDIEEKVFEEIELFNTYEDYVSALRSFVIAHNDYLLNEFALRANEVEENYLLDTAFYYNLHILGDTTFVLGIAETKNEDFAATACLRYCDPSLTDQQWQVRPLEKGWQFINRANGLALSDYNLSEPYSYALVTCDPDDADTRQQWMIEKGNVAGYYNLLNVSTGRIIDDRRANYTDGNEVISYSTSSNDAKTANRLWRFTAVAAKDDISTALQNATVQPDYSLRFVPSQSRLRFIAADRNQLDFDVHVCDLQGRRLLSFRAADGGNIGHLPSGVYVVAWNQSGIPHSVKFKK